MHLRPHPPALLFPLAALLYLPLALTALTGWGYRWSRGLLPGPELRR